MLRTLNSRLLASYIVVIVVCLVLVGLGLLVFVRSSPLWTLTLAQRLDAVARATIPVITRAGPDNPLPPDQLYDLLDQIAAEQEVRILMVDGTGTMVFDSEEEWVGLNLPTLTPSGRVRPRVQASFTDPDGERWLLVGENLPTGAGRQLQLVFAVPIVRRQLLLWFAQNLLPPIIQAGLVALVLSALLAWLVSRSVARPLEEVAEAAGAIAQGDLDQRAPVSGPEEAQELAYSFNRMIEQVTSAQQAQRDFVANVSHELKTPLTSIQGFSQAILDGTADDPDSVGRSASIIHGEAGRMHRMVEELLGLARFDAGQVELAQDKVDLSIVLSKCVERMGPQAETAGNELLLSAQDGLIVTGDADWLTQVFINLIDNGIRHTSDARVDVAASETDGWIEVSVTDNGEGIPPEDLDRVFERFYQADRSRQRKGGVGLGLSIAREVVQRHGGDISAESMVGLGTRFTVHLPARRSDRDKPGDG
jgi:signal transduction histidine kinase